MIMVISITASTTAGKPLPDEVLRETIHACDRVLALDSSKKKLLDFLETRIGIVTPNLSDVIGSTVMVASGGLHVLANMPSCNVKVLGAKKTDLEGFSTATSLSRVGYIEETDIFQSTPVSLRTRAGKLLAGKSDAGCKVGFSWRRLDWGEREGVW